MLITNRKTCFDKEFRFVDIEFLHNHGNVTLLKLS